MLPLQRLTVSMRDIRILLCRYRSGKTEGKQMNTEKISGLEEKLEYTFKDQELLTLALSHSSYVNELTVRNRQ